MHGILSLSHVEETELWLESLVVHFRQGSRSAMPGMPAPPDGNYQKSLKHALQVMQHILRGAPELLKIFIETESSAERAAMFELSDIRKQVRADAALSENFAEFLAFWDFLDRYLGLGVTLSRLEDLSAAEFRNYGLVFSDTTRNYVQGDFHQRQSKRFHATKYHHLVHREILCHLEMEGLRDELERLFLQFFKVLSTVEYFQDLMRRSFKYQKLMILLRFCYVNYKKLLLVLNQSHHFVEYYHPELADAIASIKFALRMETRRIFGQELQDLNNRSKLDEIYAQMETALGLLRHASQQSFTTLVRQINPTFDELSLFHELRREYADSKQLLGDLNELYVMACDEEVQQTDPGFMRLIREVKAFRAGSMRLLYFKDWKPIEQFAEELTSASDHERAFILHRFEVYVSTLIGEVGKRAILNRAERLESESSSSFSHADLQEPAALPRASGLPQSYR